METMTVEEVVKKIKPSLLLPDNFTHQDKWIEAQVEDLSLDLKYKLKRMSKNKVEIPTGTIPTELYSIFKQIILFSFNRQRSEGLNSHSEGGEAMSWKDVDHDKWSKHSQQLSDFIQGTDYANGFQFFS